MDFQIADIPQIFRVTPTISAKTNISPITFSIPSISYIKYKVQS